MMIKDYKHLVKLQHVQKMSLKNAFKECESEMMIVKDFFDKNYTGSPFFLMK